MENHLRELLKVTNTLCGKVFGLCRKEVTEKNKHLASLATEQSRMYSDFLSENNDKQKTRKIMARPQLFWTEEMLEDLIIYYPITPDKLLAKRLYVSTATLRRKAKEMRLKKTNHYRFNFEIWDMVMNKYGLDSVREIAKEAGVCERTIYHIIKRLRIEVGEERLREIYSNAAKRMIKREQSRKTFGIESRVYRPIGRNKSRVEVARQLSEHGYIVIKGSMYVYYCTSMTRYEDVELAAKSVGFKLVQWEKE